MPAHPAQTGPILNNLKFLYSKPAIDPIWVADTLQSIHERSPGLSLQQQIKQVNIALLESDLEQSTIQGTGFPLELINGADMMHQQVLFQGQKQGCLVMVMAITEIGASAYNLKRTLDDKREVRSGRAQIRRLPVEEEGAEDGLGNGKEEDEKEGTGPKYTRSMLKFTLSDGVHEVEAIEYRKIPNLVLGETRLGCKLILQNVKVLRGLLLLTPENCSVKGYSVPQWCEGNRDEIALERSLNDRLGIDPEPQHPIASSTSILSQVAYTEGYASRHSPVDIDFHDDDIIEKKEKGEEDYVPEGFELMPAHMPSTTIPARQSKTIENSTSTSKLDPVLPSRRAAPYPAKQPAPKRQNSSTGKRATTKAEEDWDLDMAIAEAEGMNEDDWAALDDMNDVGVVKQSNGSLKVGQSRSAVDHDETSSRFFRPPPSTVARSDKSLPVDPSSISTAGKKEPIVLSDEEETRWTTYRSSQLGAVRDQRSSQQGVLTPVPDSDIIEID